VCCLNIQQSLLIFTWHLSGIFPSTLSVFPALSSLCRVSVDVSTNSMYPPRSRRGCLSFSCTSDHHHSSTTVFNLDSPSTHRLTVNLRCMVVLSRPLKLCNLPFDLSLHVIHVSYSPLPRTQLWCACKRTRWEILLCSRLPATLNNNLVYSSALPPRPNPQGSLAALKDTILPNSFVFSSNWVLCTHLVTFFHSGKTPTINTFQKLRWTPISTDGGFSVDFCSLHLGSFFQEKIQL